jgi:hypothetical protein
MLKQVIQQGRRREITGGVPSGYVEDYFDPRTKLGIVFSCTLDERRERCIHHRAPDHPFQPGGHEIFPQRGSVQSCLNVKSRLIADDPDYGRGVPPFRKQLLCLKLTEGAVEAAIRIDHRSNLRQVVERTMHRTAIDGAGGGFNRLKVKECVL